MYLKFETLKYFSVFRLSHDLSSCDLVHQALKWTLTLTAALPGVSLALIQKTECFGWKGL